MPNFTASWVKSVEPGVKVEEYLDGTSGLGLRVRPNGRKLWFSRYTFEGKQTKLQIGEFPSMPLVKAREANADVQRKIELNVNPQGRKVTVDGMSVNWLCDEYIERYAKLNKKSWAFDEYILDKEVKPRWGKKHISDVTKQMVIDLIDEVVDRGAPVHAARVLACVAKMFNWAIDRGSLEQTPCYRVKPPKKALARDRVLSESEIVKLWHALDEQQHFSPLMRIVIKLGMLLLQRRGEIIGMKVEELNLKQKIWMLPKERTKSGRAHIVPLSDTAIKLIRLAMQLSPSGVHVFAIKAAEPYSDETDETGGESIAPMVVTGPTRAIHRNRAWMEKRGIGAFTFHDLRRTGASHMPRLGVSRAHVSMVLNHAQRGMTAEVYDWYEYLNEKRVALDTWAQRIERLVSCEIEPDDIEVEAVEMEEEEAD